MKKILMVSGIFVFSFCTINNLTAQLSTESFLSKLKPFVTAKFSNRDIAFFKNLSDSFSEVLIGHRVKQTNFVVEFHTSNGSNINFSFSASTLKVNNEQACSGHIIVSRAKGFQSVICGDVYSSIAKFGLIFDSIKVADRIDLSCVKMYLHFNNFKLLSYKILQKTDKKISTLVKDEYYNFCFGNVNATTSDYQLHTLIEKNIFSHALVSLINNGDITTIFEIISLNNEKYSWLYAEGMWYYNFLYPTLKTSQVEILKSYNGKKGKPSFRPKKTLQNLYQFDSS